MLILLDGFRKIRVKNGGISLDKPDAVIYKGPFFLV